MIPRRKILHIISACSVGGCEAHVLALLRGLDHDRYERWLAYFEEQPDEAAPIVEDFRLAGVRTVDLHGRGRIDAAATLRLMLLLRRKRFDLVHTHSLRAELAAALATRCIARPPKLIRTVHNTDEYYCRAPARWLTRLSGHSLDAVVGISDAVLAHLRRYASLPEQKMARIHYGIDPGPYLHVEPRSRATDRPTIGMIARLSPQKGHTLLIDSLPTIIRRLPDLRLVLVGHEQEYTRAQLRAYAEERGVAANITFTGFRDDVAALLANWDVLVLPSLWEGFGLVLLEAMAAGRPVVASRVGPIPEIVVDGQTGLLVEPGRPEALAAGLLQVLEDPDLSVRLGKSGRRRVIDAFGLHRMLRENEAVYERLLDGSPLVARTTDLPAAVAPKTGSSP